MLFQTLLKQAPPKPFALLLIFQEAVLLRASKNKNDSVTGAGEAAAFCDAPHQERWGLLHRSPLLEQLSLAS